MFRVLSAALSILLLSAQAGYGQPRQQIVEDSPWFLRAGFVPSYVLPTSDFLSGANAAGKPIRWAPDATIEIGRQTDGSRMWHHLYKLPAYGVGFSAAWFNNAREIGRPLEAYWFFSWPLFRLLDDDVEVTTDFSTGLSWRWQEYDGTTNPYNKVIGSDLNVRLEWGFYVHYIITPRVSVYGGLDFTHRSNGELLQPNEGINSIGPRVALRYNLSDQRREPVLVMMPPLPAFHPAWEVVVGATGSDKNVLERLQPLVRPNFGAARLNAALQRHFYRYGKAAAGADVTYDGSTGARIDPSTNEMTRAVPAERWALGVYGGYEHIIERFSLVAQVGYVVARGFEEPDATRLYERYGWRYRLTNRLSAAMDMRLIKAFNATQIEIGAEYRLH